MALKRGIVKLEEHTNNWTKEYFKEKELLLSILGDRIIEIHHVGSTSIKGLKAKPIIDILIVINSLDEISEIEKLLSKYNYENRGPQGILDRVFFAKGSEDARTHYVQFTTLNSDTYYNLLYFKKYLNEHPKYIERYCKLKEELAVKYANERSLYTKGKNDFIKEIINMAKNEYNVERKLLTKD